MFPQKDPNERLHESEAHFRAFADSASVLIWVGRAQTGCEFANKASLAFFGKTLEEVQGFGWKVHLHPDDTDRYTATYREAFRARAPFRCRARFRNAKGEYRWLDSAGMPRFAASGEFLGYAATSIDITDTVQTELNAQFINQLDLELSRVSDPGEIVRLAVERLCEYLDVVGCQFVEIDRATDLAIVREAWQNGLPTVSSASASYRIADFLTPELRIVLETGQPVVVNDVSSDRRTPDLASKYQSFGVNAFVWVPIRHEKLWVATLTVSASLARDWHPNDVQLMHDISTRLWLAVTKAQAVQALRDSEQQARRTLAEQMLAGIAECDTSGRFIMVNQRFCDITGHTKDTLLAFGIADITHEEDWPQYAALLQQLHDTGKSYFLEQRYRLKSGSEIWVQTHVSPVFDQNGRIEGTVSIVIDVSDRKRVEQELAAAKDRLAADLDAMTRLQRIGASFVREGDLPAVLGEILETAIVITHAEKGTIQLIDPPSGKLTLAAQRGFEQEYLDFWNVVEEGRGVCGTVLKRGEREIVEDVTLSPIFVGKPDLDVELQAGVRAVQSTPVLGRSGKTIAILSTHHHTPCRPDQRALRFLDLLAAQTGAILERAQAEKVLRSAYEHAEAATRAKDEFLTVVSHELRSPLTAIVLYARLLRTTEPDVGKLKRMAEVIERNGDMQLQLIEDLLDTARIISGKLKLDVKPVDLFSVITNAIDVVMPSAQAKGIEFQTDLDAFAGQVTGDPDRLQQVVWNLLSNAVKFTPKGGSLEVTLKRDDPHIQIVVRDSGKGIEPDFLPHVFDRFRQSDMSSTRRAGGLGLGLSLVKNLVELHGGTVDAESAGPNRGATFTIRLPLRAIYTPPSGEHKTPAGYPKRAIVGVRALIVDDEEEVCKLLAGTLEDYGAEVEAASSGQQAIERLALPFENGQFDVLICDIGMPDEDGYAVMRRLRMAPPDKGGTIPAIALTAYGRAEDRVRALQAGFQMHVAKPVDPDELVAVILSLVKRFGATFEK